MGGSPKPPEKSDEEEEMEKLQKELLEAQLEQAKKPIDFPEIKPPEPLPPPPPPAIQTSADIEQAEQEARRAAGRRVNSARNTLFAGSPTKSRTLLG